MADYAGWGSNTEKMKQWAGPAAPQPAAPAPAAPVAAPQKPYDPNGMHASGFSNFDVERQKQTGVWNAANRPNSTYRPANSASGLMLSSDQMAPEFGGPKSNGRPMSFNNNSLEDIPDSVAFAKRGGPAAVERAGMFPKSREVEKFQADPNRMAGFIDPRSAAEITHPQGPPKPQFTAQDQATIDGYHQQNAQGTGLQYKKETFGQGMKRGWNDFATSVTNGRNNMRRYAGMTGQNSIDNMLNKEPYQGYKPSKYVTKGGMQRSTDGAMGGLFNEYKPI
jgi:hypothetical protein